MHQVVAKTMVDTGLVGTLLKTVQVSGGEQLERQGQQFRGMHGFIMRNMGQFMAKHPYLRPRIQIVEQDGGYSLFGVIADGDQIGTMTGLFEDMEDLGPRGQRGGLFGVPEYDPHLLQFGIVGQCRGHLVFDVARHYLVGQWPGYILGDGAIGSRRALIWEWLPL